MAQRAANRHESLFWLWLKLIVLPGAAQAQTERSLGIYRVEKTGDEYRMVPVNQTTGPGVINSKGLFDVRFSDEDWAFKSDWGNRDVAQFHLRRAAPGVYLGWSYLREEKRNFNMWVLVR
jgi:hypothetical protein